MIPFQLIVGMVLLFMFSLVYISNKLDNKLHISKPINKLIQLIPNFINEYHIKYYITYSTVLLIGLVGLITCWDPIWLLATYSMRYVWSGIGAEVANHRYFTHRSFKCSPTMEKVLKICGIYSIEGPTMMWVAQHRAHHKYSDTELDPHPGNIWHSTFSRVNVPDNIKEKITPLTIKDLLNDSWHKYIKDNYFVLYWIPVSICLLVGFKITVYFVILPGLLAMIDSTLVNWLNHTYGVKQNETNDNSTNNYWLNLWAPGGALHNNHHHDAANYHNERLWWEFDFFKPIIKYIIATKTFKENK